MSSNIGKSDRVIRALLGIGLFILFFATRGSVRWLALAALVLVITAVVGSCPLYALLGLKTNDKAAAPSSANDRVD